MQWQWGGWLSQVGTIVEVIGCLTVGCGSKGIGGMGGVNGRCVGWVGHQGGGGGGSCVSARPRSRPAE